MPGSDPYRKAMRALHDVYHSGPDADIHLSPSAGPQPGTAEFMESHLVGHGQAPERFIERIDGVGSEGLGVVEVIDGRTGRSIKHLKLPRVGLDRD